MIVIADIEKKSFSADKQQKNVTTCEKSTSIHYELIRQLTYKEEWHGGLVIKLPAEEQKASKEDQASRAKCSAEKNVDAESAWTKACNLLAAGLAVTACGGEVAKHSPMKQEP